jgi:hypothetical protein
MNLDAIIKIKDFPIKFANRLKRLYTMIMLELKVSFQQGKDGTTQANS